MNRTAMRRLGRARRRRARGPFIMAPILVGELERACMTAPPGGVTYIPERPRPIPTLYRVHQPPGYRRRSS